MSDDKSDPDKKNPPSFVAVLIAIFPPPIRAADEFTLTAISATEGYSTDSPVMVGQYPLHGAQSLTVQVRIQPAPPPPIVNAPPRFADGWPEEPAAFATALRKARIEAGLSQNRLAYLAGYSEMTLRNIETNRYASTAESRGRLIEALAKAREGHTTRTETQRRTSSNPTTPSATPQTESGEKTDEPDKPST